MRRTRAHERKAIRRQAADLLEGLGASNAEVATSLAGYQVRGRPRDAQGCAVAVYLRAVLGADPRIKAVKVSETSVRVSLVRRGRRVQVCSPPAVRRFVESFDHGLFPALVRPATNGRRALAAPDGSEPQAASPT